MTVDQFVIEARLSAETEFLCYCILLLYTQQESDEQGAHLTFHENGRGFNHGDAPFLSTCAEHISQHQCLPHNSEQEAVKRMKKYVRQLSELLTEEDL